MSDNTNTIDIAALGAKAVQSWKAGDRENGKGDSLATFALINAWATTTFVATVKAVKKSDDDEVNSFDLAEHYNNTGCTNANGTKNVKLIAARTKAISEKVFGIADPDNAFKQRLARTLEVVANVFRLGYDETNFTLNDKNQLRVPYPLLNAEPDDKASENERNMYDMLSDSVVALDGKNKNSMAELSRQVKPKIERSAKEGATPDKGASFLASVKFVSATITAVMGENAPDDMPAPTDEVRKEMHALFLALGDYFTADPVEDDQPTKKSAAK